MTCLKSLQLWDSVGLLTENGHSKTHVTLFIKVLKVVQLCVMSCGWNAMIKVHLCGEAAWRLARGPL